MRSYAIVGQGAAGTNKTILTLVGATTIRPEVFYLLIGSDDTPADAAYEFSVNRITAAGTAGSSVTPQALDPGDPASLATSGSGVFSGEPTYTSAANLLMVGMNQRATFQFFAHPDHPLKIPATASNGLGVRCISASTGTANINSTIHFRE